MRALVNNDQEIAQLLLEKGADPNIYGMGISPWLYVAGITSGTGGAGGRGGGGGGAANTTLLDLMLKHGADVNGQVTGAATYSGRWARALTGPQSECNTSREGMTALHAAVQGGNTALVRYLLDHGARADIVDGSGRTPMDILNGAPALQPATFADAEGLLPIEKTNPNCPQAPANAAARGAGRGNTGNPEIRTLLQAALQPPVTR
jgi:ankyrin repeat protein